MRVLRQDHRTPAVRELMSRTLSAAGPDWNLVQAAARMRELEVSSLVVLGGEVPLGIITERDLVRALADARDPLGTRVSDCMTSSPVSVEITERATMAAALMDRHRVRHLLVTDRGRVAGCISARDLLRVHLWPVSPADVEPW